MIPDFKNTKELLSFIRNCKRIGVTTFKLGEIEFSVDPSTPEPRPNHRPKKNATSKALAKKPDGTIEEMTEEEAEAEEFRMSQLRIDDPEAFEEHQIKRMSGDGA